MNLRNMFYDGEAKACAARLPGMAFVHPIEALKHMGLVFFRYADAVVRKKIHHRLETLLASAHSVNELDDCNRSAFWAAYTDRNVKVVVT